MFTSQVWQVIYWYGEATADSMYGKEYYNSREKALEEIERMKFEAFEPDGNMHYVIRQFDFTATVKKDSI